jgi:hypothetical protein
MTNAYKTIPIVCLSLALVSCNTSSAPDDLVSSAGMSTAAVTVLPVAVAGYGTSYAGKAGWQNLSIALDAPDVLYAEEIEYVPAPAFDPAYAKLPAFADNYWYMGSKGDYNYLMHYPPFGLRKVLKIKKSNHEISDPFPLTSLSKSWRRLNFSPQFNFARLNYYDGVADPPVADVFQFDLFPGAGLHRQRLGYDALYGEDGDLLMPEIIIRETDVHDFERLQRDHSRQRYILLDDEPTEPTVPKERD